MHVITLPELVRIVDAAPGNEELAALLRQLAEGDTTLRVDLTALLKKPD